MTSEKSEVTCIKNYLKAAEAHCAGDMLIGPEHEFTVHMKNDDQKSAFAALLSSAKEADYKNAEFWRHMQIAAEGLELADVSTECSDRLSRSET